MVILNICFESMKCKIYTACKNIVVTIKTSSRSSFESKKIGAQACNFSLHHQKRVNRSIKTSYSSQRSDVVYLFLSIKIGNHTTFSSDLAFNSKNVADMVEYALPKVQECLMNLARNVPDFANSSQDKTNEGKKKTFDLKKMLRPFNQAKLFRARVTKSNFEQ